MSLDLSELRFLVVDDMGPMRTTLRRMLSELGAEKIDIASTAADALQLMSHQRYQVVLCDYNLGDGKDGEQVLEEARHRHLVPVSAAYLMVTAESTRPMVLGVLEHHPDDYLIKPFVSEVLLQRLQRCIHRKRALAPVDEAVTRGDYVNAIALCDQLGDADPRRTLEIRRLKGELLLKLQLGDEAASHYETVLEEREYPWALYGLAQARRHQGRLDDARALLERLIELHPRLIEAYDCLAEIHELQNKPAQAQRILEEAVRLSPKSVRRQRRFAALAAANGELDTAIQAFRSAINLGKDSFFGGGEEYAGLADAMHRNGDDRRAGSVLRDARKRFRERPRDMIRVIGQQASLYRALGQHSDADGFVSEAVDMAEQNPDVLDTNDTLALARNCLLSDLHREAGIAMLSSLARNRHDDTATMAAVNALCREAHLDAETRGRIDAARQELVSLNNRGVALFQKGLVEQASELFVKAAEELPRNRTILLNASKALLASMRERGPERSQLLLVRDYLERLREHPDPTGGYAQSLRVYRRLAIQAGAA